MENWGSVKAVGRTAERMQKKYRQKWQRERCFPQDEAKHGPRKLATAGG